jgi:hypothetical protein
MALGEFCSVCAMDQRDVRVDRLFPSHGADQHQLAERVVEMVIAANNVGDAHVMIIDHDRQHVGGRPVRAQQHKIVQLGIVHGDITLHQIGDCHAAFFGSLEPHDIGRSGGRFGRIAVAPAAIIAHRQLFLTLFSAHRFQFFGSGEAFIRMAVGEQVSRDFGMARGAGKLHHNLAVPIEIEPFHAFDNCFDCIIGGARTVCIFDAQQEFSTHVAGIEPVVERGARAADMEVACGGGRKARHNRAIRGTCAHALILQSCRNGERP